MKVATMRIRKKRRERRGGRSGKIYWKEVLKIRKIYSNIVHKIKYTIFTIAMGLTIYLLS